MTEAWIIDACRTPRGIGRIGKGALADIHPQQLGATVLKAIAERNDIDTADVDDVIWGTSSQVAATLAAWRRSMLVSTSGLQASPLTGFADREFQP
jgi:acetyl-CoA acetyltransferase